MNITEPFTIIINEKSIMKVVQAKYIGQIIDLKLNWNKHIVNGSIKITYPSEESDIV